MTSPHNPIPAEILIRQAELLAGGTADFRVRGGRISAVGDFMPMPGELVIEARGGLLLPGLHDHHIHMAASAAALASVACGPPDIVDEAGLAQALCQPGTGWLRGIGYHESVAGMIDRDWLDAAVPDRPVRVQHRSGRMWVFNSAGLDLLLAKCEPSPPGLEQVGGRWSGRLFDEDAWLRGMLGSVPPAFDAAGADLARHGVTGVTEMSPTNDDAMVAHFASESARGALPQRLLIAGGLALDKRHLGPFLAIGQVKIHLHEAHLPAFDEVVALIRAGHAQGRGIAVHCVTEVELVFTLAAFDEAGVQAGDRIEHASVANAEAVTRIAAMRLPVVTQPYFVAERGDAYRAMIPPAEWPDLYRLRSLLDAGVELAGGSDAPFGKMDPWAAMAAAVSRRTAAGCILGEAEALTPEQALALFLADPLDLPRQRNVAPGAAADLCLLSEPWAIARENLRAGLVRATVIAGRIVHGVID